MRSEYLWALVQESDLPNWATLVIQGWQQQKRLQSVLKCTENGGQHNQPQRGAKGKGIETKMRRNGWELRELGEKL